MASDSKSYWLWVACSLSCACAHRSASESSAANAENPALGSSHGTPLRGPQAPAPFSGEIVYQQTSIPKNAPWAATDVGDVHFFISGAHWKEVNSDGITTSLYDPDANVVHYFKPKRKTLDASRADGTVHFEPLQETKTVLGHECKALRQSWANISVVVYYDLGIFVDPKPYAHTMLAHMGEGLAVRNGALKLASTLELANETIYAEATSLSQRSFEPSFWSLANNEPIAEADAGPATSAPE